MEEIDEEQIEYEVFNCPKCGSKDIQITESIAATSNPYSRNISRCNKCGWKFISKNSKIKDDN